MAVKFSRPEPNSDTSSCNLIKMSPNYFIFHKDLQVADSYVQSLNFNYILITAFILKPWSGFKSRCLNVLRNRCLEHEIFFLHKIESICIVFYVNTKY